MEPQRSLRYPKFVMMHSNKKKLEKTALEKCGVLVRKNKFRTNNYFTESNNLILPKSKDVFVYEYDVDLKDNSKNKEGVEENEE